jgi:hypothetical protein
MEQRHQSRLQKRKAEERGAASGEGNFAAEPRDDGEVQRQQHGHGDGDFTAAEVDEGGVGECEDDNSQNEPIAPGQQTEEDAPAEDDQRYRL